MAKKKKSTIGHRYRCSAHAVLCHGPVDSITKISFQDKDAYLNEESQNKTIFIDKPALFGGDEQAGGVQGGIELHFGASDQPKSSKLQEICSAISDAFGGLISAYRGVLSVVFDGFYYGTSPQFPESTWRVKRIHTRHDGEKQWYDSKAEIGTISVVDIAKIAFILDDSGSMSAENMSNMKAGVNNILSKLADQKVDVMVQAINSGVRIYRQATSVNIAAAQNFVNSLVASGGTSATSAYGNINAFFNNDFKNGQVITLSDGEMQNVAQAKTMISDAFSKAKFIGLGMGTVGSLNEFDNTGNPVQVVDADGISAALNSIFYSEADINPAHIIRECLTNPVLGIGVLETDTGDVSFKKTADVLFNENMGMSIKWDDSTSIEEFIDIIKKHINAELYFDKSDAKWKLYLIRADYNADDLDHLNESHVRNLEFERRTLAECVNSVTLTYWDRERSKDSTVTVQDIARIAQQGGVVFKNIEYRGFTNSDIASRVAYRELQTLSANLASVSFDVSENQVKGWHLGMPFKLSDEGHGLAGAIFRVKEMRLGDGINNTVVIDAVEDSFSSPMQAVVEYVPPIKTNFDAMDATAIAFEVPYIELVEQYGQDEIDAKLEKNPDLSFVGMAAIRPNNSHINAALYGDAGAGYDEVSTLDFCPVAELKTAISYTDSVLQLQNVREFNLVKTGNRLQVGSELMSVVNYDAETKLLTVKRGVFDTVPAQHLAGSTLYVWDNYSGLDGTEYLSGEVVSLKALTQTNFDQLNLNEATAHEVTCVASAIRPYPPANVKINGSYWPAYIDADLTITWSNRNRIQQTGGDPLGWFDASVSLEPNIATMLIITELDENHNELATSNLNVTAVNSYTLQRSLMQANTEYLDITLKTARDSYECINPFHLTVVNSNLKAPDNVKFKVVKYGA